MRASSLAAFAASALLLVSCGGQQSTADNEAEASPVPSGYRFDRDDLWQDKPRDICRARDEGFLQALMERVGRALPPAVAGTMQFRDFNVTDGNEGRGREAVLRFVVDRDGQKGVLMYAVGEFDPAACGITKLRAGVGAAPDPKIKEIAVP